MAALVAITTSISVANDLKKGIIDRFKSLVRSVGIVIVSIPLAGYPSRHRMLSP